MSKQATWLIAFLLLSHTAGSSQVMPAEEKPELQPAAYSYQTVDMPGAQSTFLNGINNLDQVVGGAYRPNGYTDAFVLDKGMFRVLSYPGSFTTGLLGINDAGTVIGFYYSGVTDVFFVLTTDNIFTDVAYPGALYTYANGLNGRGDIVGTAYVGTQTIDYMFDGAYHPLAASLSLQGINNSGDLLFIGKTKSFVSGAGTGVTLAVPGADHTRAAGINNPGQVVGSYKTGHCGGSFLYSGGTYLAIDVPGSLPCSTLASALNDRGTIVGYYNDPTGGGHGFTATPSPPSAGIE